MQLTKDDIETFPHLLGPDRHFINISKFQQVVEFYEKYNGRYMKFIMSEPKLCDLFINSLPNKKESINDNSLDIPGRFEYWLFSFCFKDGLK